MLGDNRKGKKQTKVRTKRSMLFLLPLIFAIITSLIGMFLIYSASAGGPTSVYSSTKKLHAFDQNGQLAAWVNVTLRTNTSAPQYRFPINVTLTVRGIDVPTGNWTYAILEGATAAFPDKEPLDWEYDPKTVIVLRNLSGDRFTYVGSRLLNYTCEGDWNIIIHVVKASFFIIDCIPPNPTNLPMKIYSIPSAVHIAQAESVAQMRTLDESGKARSFWSGIGLMLSSLGSFWAAVVEYRKKPERRSARQ